jgi:hypothetical protein
MGRRAKVGAIVKLGTQENDHEEHGQDLKVAGVAKHVSGKTEIRPDWLRNQGIKTRLGCATSIGRTGVAL